MKKVKLLLLLILSGCTFLAVAAGDRLTYDRISLSVTVSDEVTNDILVAILYYQRQGKNTGELANKVNQVIRQGVARAKNEPGVKIQTLDYQTYPVYQNGKLSGIWQVRQSIRLQSSDVARLSALLGELQEKLAIRQVGYQLSAGKRREVEDGLIETAIARFKQKARLVAQQLDAGDFRMVSLNISSPGSRGNLMPVMRAEMTKSVNSAAPVLETGEQTVWIAVDGVIELVRE